MPNEISAAQMTLCREIPCILCSDAFKTMLPTEITQIEKNKFFDLSYSIEHPRVSYDLGFSWSDGYFGTQNINFFYDVVGYHNNQWDEDYYEHWNSLNPILILSAGYLEIEAKVHDKMRSAYFSGEIQESPFRPAKASRLVFQNFNNNELSTTLNNSSIYSEVGYKALSSTHPTFAISGVGPIWPYLDYGWLYYWFANGGGWVRGTERPHDKRGNINAQPWTRLSGQIADARYGLVSNSMTKLPSSTIKKYDFESETRFVVDDYKRSPQGKRTNEAYITDTMPNEYRISYNKTISRQQASDQASKEAIAFAFTTCLSTFNDDSTEDGKAMVMLETLMSDIIIESGPTNIISGNIIGLSGTFDRGTWGIAFPAERELLENLWKNEPDKPLIQIMRNTKLKLNDTYTEYAMNGWCKYSRDIYLHKWTFVRIKSYEGSIRKAEMRAFFRDGKFYFGYKDYFDVQTHEIAGTAWIDSPEWNEDFVV